MTSQYRHRRSSDPTKAFVQLEPGEIAVNTANRQLALGDAASGAVGNPLQLLPLRFFDTRAIYAAGDLVYYQNVVYRSIGVSGPGAFTPGQWTMLVGVIDAQYVAKAGDTMTGALTLSGNPSDGLHAAPKQYVDGAVLTRIADTGDTMTGPLVLPAPTDPTHATNKAYVDSALANKSSVIVSDIPPAGAIDNTLWWESDTGLLYVRYNDGNSIQWVVACPQPDTSLFVARVGDTMTGPLVLPAPAPTLATHASNKAYVDATAKTYSGKNYIVNGAMMVSQENGSTPVTLFIRYPVDEWYIAGTIGGAAAFSLAQVAVRSPAGSPNRIRLTVTGANAAPGATYAILAQKLEGLRVADLLWGTAAAKTVTLQLGIKAPVAGTYTATIFNGPEVASTSGIITIAAGEVNTDVVKTVTFTGMTTGAWSIDNTAGFEVVVYLVKSGQTANVFATNGNVFELFDVSLTEGPNAPPFKVPDYASELAACQRYYHKTSTVVFRAPAITGINYVWFPWPITIRAVPTVSLANIAPVTTSGHTIAQQTINGAELTYTASAASGYFQCNVIANARL